MHTRSLDYKGYRIEATAEQDSNRVWGFAYSIDPEPEVLHTKHPRVVGQLPTRRPWDSADDALTAAIAEACAVIDVQIRDGRRQTPAQ